MNFGQLIYNEVKRSGIPDPLASLIVAQAGHETAQFSSRVFKYCNNLFGYKYVGQSLSTGPCVDSPEGNAYARYKRWQDSVQELVAWIKRRQKEGVFPDDLTAIQSPEQYANLLKKASYYGDSVTNYAAGLRRFFFSI